MKEKVKVTTNQGKVINVYKSEATMLERLGKLVKEHKAAVQTKEEKKQPETKKVSGPMTKDKNLKNVKSGN